MDPAENMLEESDSVAISIEDVLLGDSSVLEEAERHGRQEKAFYFEIHRSLRSMLTMVSTICW
jgi:hypothetical protein